MTESDQKPAKSSSLVPLAPKQTEGAVKDLKNKGATFFNWEEFRKLTKGLPPNTKISDILAMLRKRKK
jgi:hypothetical protein